MIEAIIEQRRRSLGGILEVGRVLPAQKRLMVGPFIFFDHIGPIDIPAGVDRSADTRAHPHIGLSTVTYLFSGEMMHRDSLGYALPVRPQEVNWMTAGSGITHSERLEKGRAVGDRLHGIQAWVALPTEHEETAPAFAHYEGTDLPFWDEVGVRGHLIAGSAYGVTSKTRTHSPLFYAHLEVEAGATAEIPGGHSERAIYVATGAVELGDQRLEAGQMAVITSQASSLRAAEAATVMVLGGEPVGERFLYWNFVSSSPDRLRQAANDWKAGRMKLPDADDEEYTPFPEHARITPPGASMSADIPEPDRSVAKSHAKPNLILAKAQAHIGETPYAVTIRVGRHVVTADEPEALGGKDAGPTPFGLLVAALGACTSATLKMYAEKKGWALTALDVDLRYLRSPSGGGERIERMLTIEGLDEPQAARLAEIAERTPVTLALKGGVAIDTTLSGSRT